MNKVVMFGIDGGDYNLITKWKKDLPTLSRLMDGGTYGRSESVIPTLSCPAWPCMFTGQTPSELGMYDFLNLETGKIFDSRSWWEKSIFHTLGNKGIKLGLLNIPISYPPHKVNGFLVTGLGTPTFSNAIYTYPESLQRELGDYEVFPLIDISIKGKEESNLALLENIHWKRVKALRKLIKKDWNFFACVFYAIDPVQHYFWHHMDKAHPRYVPNSKYEDVIKKFYIRIDNEIGNTLSVLPKDIDVVIVSDHGFGPYWKGFNINRWLEQEGYLTFKKEYRKFLDKFQGVAITLASLSGGKLTKLVPDWIKAPFTTSRKLQDMTIGLYEAIDWSKTVAYSPSISSGCIYIKDSKNKTFQENRISIKEGLGDLGLQVVGGFFNEAPNLFIVGNKYYPMNTRGKEIWNEHAWSASHTLDAIFIGYGPNFEHKEVKDMSICKVAPIILDLFKEA